MFGFREVSPEREKQILADLGEAAKFHTPFLVLVGSSAVIATFGLLLNSPVVVIGAMLVAPLMTPIFSLSAALVRGRVRLMEQALVTEAYGVGLSIALAVLIGLLVPEPELTAEILARMRPTLFDLAVALAASLFVRCTWYRLTSVFPQGQNAPSRAQVRLSQPAVRAFFG